MPFSSEHSFAEDITLRNVARMGEERGETEGKNQMGRLWRRWVDNTRMDLQEVECGYIDWIGLA